MPSVPKNLRVMTRALARLTDPAPDSCRNGVNPGGDQEEDRAANERDCAGISETPCEWNERRLGGPFVPRFAHQPRFFAVLAEGAGKREDDNRTIKHERLGLPEDHQVDAGPNCKAPHHRVPGDGEDSPRSALRSGSPAQTRLPEEPADKHIPPTPH